MGRLAGQEVTGSWNNTDGADIIVNTTGANFLAFIVEWRTDTTNQPTATVDGAAATAHGSTPSESSCRNTMFYINNPTQGASITVAIRGSDTSWRGCAVVAPYSGVDTTAPVGAFPTGVAGTDAAPITPVFTAGADDWPLMWFGMRGNNPARTVSARGTGQALIAEASSLPTSSSGCALVVDDGTAGDTQGDWTLSGTIGWGSAGVAINPAAGGSPFTLTADPASVAVTGTAATLAHNRHVDAQAGSVAITGTAATLAHNRRLSAEAAAVAITGTDATLTHNTTTTFTLTAESGAFTITGTAATLAYNRHLIAEPGSVAITGSPITLRLIINGTPGSFVITPTDATLTYRRKITAEAGTVAVTGTAATLRHNRVLPADSGSFAITGTDATLTYSAANRITIVADPGAFVITPTDATLRTTRRIAAASGSIVWTGQDATLLLASRRLVAESASFAITGTAATLTYSAAVVADPSVTIQTTARTRTVETT